MFGTRKLRVFAVILGAVTLTAALLRPQPEVAPPTALAAEKPLSAAYVYDRAGLTLRDSDAANLDQLYFSFALLRDGRVSGDHWQSIKTFQAYTAKHPNILPILSIGGWGAGGFSEAAATEDGRAAFVESALKLMERYGFRGVDIDWEYPGSSAAGIVSSSNDRANFTLLLKALRSGLDELTAADGMTRRLCIAVGAYPSLVSNIDCAAVGRIVDQVNLMTYDLQSANAATHHAALYSGNSAHPLSADMAIDAYAAAGIPLRKMALGVAFYGHKWSVSGENPLDQVAKKVGVLNYSRIKPLIESHPERATFDESAQAPYYADGSVFISYDDTRSIAAKKQYASRRGLLGLIAWEYGGDADGELLAAMR